ncbi:MAG: putative calcium-binding protein 39 [Streblomastix strix]|uniref:Putative calcium-binding protein 39 n=1 Tax=Streblomastix strix TaxID=222440 RepID=A0A5J4TRY4_9EUKA|nr:MAG: putative calcium-binding protein 39 [Streblomastix strix]
MTRYIADSQHLKQIMILLRDTAKTIQFEAFHVFKVFVANPNKPREICDVLARNKEKLITFLSGFHTDRVDDQFTEEKKLLVEEISKLQLDPR